MSDEKETSNPFNAWWWIAGGFLLLIVVLVAVVIATSSGSEPDPDPSSDISAAPSPSSTTGAELDEDDTCIPGGANQDIPVSGPEAQWEAVGYFMVPTSPEYGPVDGPEPLWPCFAHSPTGALFAAANFFAGLGEPNYEEFSAVAAVDNPALPAWLATQDPSDRTQTPGRVAQIAGFQFQQVEPDAVIVSLGFRQEDIEAEVRISMVWDDALDNWRGDLATSQLTPSIADLAAFTSWGATDG